MLFTNKQFPVLEKLSTGKLGQIAIPEEDVDLFPLQQRRHANELFAQFAHQYRRKVRFLKEPFVQAMMKAKTKLFSTELMNQRIEDCGTFIMGRNVMCYSVITEAGIDQPFIGSFFLFRENILMAYAWTNHETGILEGTVSTFLKATELLEMPEEEVGDANDKLVLFKIFADIVLFYNFCKYAEVDVDIVGANKRLKTPVCKYVNQTNTGIEVLDSTWFTTLAKLEGFGVHGHFRWQPHGPGKKQRRLQWISEYQKKGYIRNFKRPVDITDENSQSNH